MTKDDLHIFDPAIHQSGLIKEAIYIKDFGAQETIIIERDSTAQVYFILSGTVKVTSFHSKGKEVWHANLSAGDTFGEMAAISGNTRSATVVTTTASRIGILPKAAFMHALESDPALTLYFLKDMVTRLESTTLYSNQRIALDVPARICAELLRQACEPHDSKGDWPVDSALTVTELGRRINANRETVSRTISGLIKAGIVKKIGRRFFITDIETLKERAKG